MAKLDELVQDLYEDLTQEWTSDLGDGSGETTEAVHAAIRRTLDPEGWSSDFDKPVVGGGQGHP